MRKHEHMPVLVAQCAKFADEAFNSTQLVGGNLACWSLMYVLKGGYQRAARHPPLLSLPAPRFFLRSTGGGAADGVLQGLSC